MSLLATSFFSCKKSVPTGLTKDKINLPNMARTANGPHLDSIFYHAMNVHNDFLDVEYAAIADSSLILGDTVAFRALDSIYLLSVGYSSAQIGALHLPVYNMIYNSLNLQATLLGSRSQDRYLSDMHSAVVMAATSGFTASQFDSAMLYLLNELDDDSTLAPARKDGYAAFLGASNGSYYYWKTNFNTWKTMVNPTVEPAEGRWLDFFMRDCAGACWGTIYGSTVPLLGSAAGALGGAAILSGMEASSWK